MFSETNLTINYPRNLAHYIALLIDLTLGEHLQMLGERGGASERNESGICDTKPAISLKRSSPEPNLLQSVYGNSVRPIDW